MRTPILLIFLFGFSIIYDVEAYPTKHEPADNSVYGIQHCVKMTQENEEKISKIVTKLSEFLYNLTLEHEVFDIRLLKIVIEGHSDDEVDEKDTQVQLVVNDCAQANEYSDGEELEEIFDEEDPYEKKGTFRVHFSDRVNEQSETKDDESNTTQTVAKNDTTNVTDNNDEESTTTDDKATTESVTDNNDATNTNNDDEDNKNNEESKTNDQTAAFDQSERYSTDNVESGKSKINIDDIEPSSSANYEVPGPVLVRLDVDKNANKLIRGTQVKRGEHIPLLLYVQRALGNVEYLFAN